MKLVLAQEATTMSLLSRPARAAALACMLSAAAVTGAAVGPAAAGTDPAQAGTAQAGTAQAGTAQAGTAQAGTLPVNYSFASGFAAGYARPDTAPPGANDGCQPSAAHPYPVVLVHGTFENMDDNWQAAAPLLANHGYCVYAFNYGGATSGADIQGTGEIAASAQQLSDFVDQVLSATGAPKVDIVGHSQGGMMPRYYIDFLGGAAKVDKLVGLAPSNDGTTVDGVVTLLTDLGAAGAADAALSPYCEACDEQFVGSSFLAKLNAAPTVSGVQYTVIESRGDEVVTPYTNAFLPAASNVTDITVQNQCPADASDHLELAYDPVALADVLNALDPSAPVDVPCVPVLPITGPTVPVPPL
jgi:triacylglycerol esterase/lipase EstA (alpha/beta hydrolase family)